MSCYYYYYFSKKKYDEEIPKSGMIYLRCLEDVIIQEFLLFAYDAILLSEKEMKTEGKIKMLTSLKPDFEL